MRKILVLVLAMIPFIASAQLTARSLKASNGQNVGFYEFKPAGYSSYTGKYPLLITLHGISERGNGTTELARVLNVGIPKNIYKYGWKMNFSNGSGGRESMVVLAPQLSSAYGSWQNFYIDEMINYAIKYLKVDPNRITLTGLSLGGGGVWKYASAASANAAKLAAIVPVCGTCNMTNASNIASNYIGTWAFHAKDDTRVSYYCSKNAVDAINAANPKKKALLTSYETGGHVIWGRAWDTTHKYQSPNVWEWILKQKKTTTSTAPAVNEAPVANAGSNKSITLPTNSVTLSGSATDDGTIASYAWTKVSGPSYGTITYPTKASTSVTGLVAGTYVYRLTVKDNAGVADTDDVTVTVNTATTINTAPIANAGADISTTSTSVSLKGTATDNGTIAKYYWGQLSGPSTATFSAYTTPSTTVSGLKPGTYVFRFRAYDAEGLGDSDDVTVVVKSSTTTTTTNKAPIAKAGADKTISTTSTSLNGSYSTDDKGIVSYRWVMLDGPAAATFSADKSASTSVSGLRSGLYKFRLRVWDAEGLIDVDDILVTVN